jgi:hypothetical protein
MAGFLLDFENQSVHDAGQKKTAGGPAVFQDSVAYFFCLREDLSTAGGA